MNLEQLIVSIVNISIKIEAVEKMLKEKGMIPYDPESITVATSDEGCEKSLGDLHREHLRLQMELRDKLLSHKMEPHISLSSDYEDFITKIAASLIDNTDVLENQLRNEFEDKIDNMVKRYKELGVFFVKRKPRGLVISRLKEALECYVDGYFQGCAILCRSAVETAIKQKFKEKLGKEPNKTLGKLLADAKKFKIVPEEDIDLADKVKTIGDNSVHDSYRCSSTEAFEALTKTKVLLNRLYQ